MRPAGDAVLQRPCWGVPVQHICRHSRMHIFQRHCACLRSSVQDELISAFLFEMAIRHPAEQQTLPGPAGERSAQRAGLSAQRVAGSADMLQCSARAISCGADNISGAGKDILLYVYQTGEEHCISLRARGSTGWTATLAVPRALAQRVSNLQRRAQE